MTPPVDTKRYKNHCFPGEIISHGVWLYYRFTLSYRDVQELLFERGVEVLPCPSTTLMGNPVAPASKNMIRTNMRRVQ